MKILGITTEKEEDKLLEFTLSLFDNVRLESQTLSRLKAVDFDTSTNLVVISISLDTIDFDKLQFLLDGINTPVFLQFTSATTNVDKKLITKVNSLCLLNKVEVWDSFVLSNIQTAFDQELGLSDLTKRIDLCKKVNCIQYQKLKIKDSESRNCGIVRSSIECGDESDY